MITTLSLTRANKLYGPHGRLGVGKTKFHEDFIDTGGDPYVPGTKVRRLKPVRIGLRAMAFIDDEIDELIEGLRRERDKNLPRRRGPTAQHRGGELA
jgi:hypothetical protein